MAKLIGSAQSTNFGENLFIRKAQEFLDDQYIIYWNRQINDVRAANEERTGGAV